MAKNVLHQRIMELVEKHGSIRAAARVLMVDHAYLYRLSTGEKDDPGDDLLRKLKLRRVVTYERTDASAPPPLERWGFNRSGFAERMADGFWTPWRLAMDALRGSAGTSGVSPSDSRTKNPD